MKVKWVRVRFWYEGSLDLEQLVFDEESARIIHLGAPSVSALTECYNISLQPRSQPFLPHSSGSGGFNNMLFFFTDTSQATDPESCLLINQKNLQFKI